MGKWEECVRKVTPYTPGEQPKQRDIIKLNTNENPYPPAPSVKAAIEEFDADSLRLYPDPECGELIDALSAHFGMRPECFFVGVGSDDVIAMAFQTFFNSGRPILFPDISYSFYSVWASLFGIPYRTPALDGDLSIVKEDYFTENGGIIFPNPNAPTGIYMELEDVEEIVKKNPSSVVIVDEAYVDFAGPSAMRFVDKYDNLLVVQTFSKSRSLAGLRVGFAVGSPKLISYLNDVKFSFNSYTLGRPTLKAAAASLSDDDYFRETVLKIKLTRERTKEGLKQLGFDFPDSGSNFIFARHRTRSGRELFEALKAAGIYVRHFDAPRIDDYLRITVGTDGEMDALLDFLQKYLQG